MPILVNHIQREEWLMVMMGYLLLLDQIEQL